MLIERPNEKDVLQNEYNFYYSEPDGSFNLTELASQVEEIFENEGNAFKSVVRIWTEI